MGLAIYNCSTVLVFVLPILSAGLGGRDTQYLIVDYAVMFIALSTVGLLYVPKLLIILSKARRRGDMVTKVAGGGGGTTQGTRVHAVGGNGYHPSQVDENGNILHSSGGTPDLLSDGGQTILRSAIDPNSPKGGAAPSTLSPKVKDRGTVASPTNGPANNNRASGTFNARASTNGSKSPPGRATMTASLPMFTRHASGIEIGAVSPSNAALMAPGGPDGAGVLTSSRSPTPNQRPLLTVDPPPIAPNEGHVIIVHPHSPNSDEVTPSTMDNDVHAI